MHLALSSAASTTTTSGFATSGFATSGLASTWIVDFIRQLPWIGRELGVVLTASIILIVEGMESRLVHGDCDLTFEDQYHIHFILVVLDFYILARSITLHRRLRYYETLHHGRYILHKLNLLGQLDLVLLARYADNFLILFGLACRYTAKPAAS